MREARVLNHNRSRSQAVIFRAISGLAGSGASSDAAYTDSTNRRAGIADAGPSFHTDRWSSQTLSTSKVSTSSGLLLPAFEYSSIWRSGCSFSVFHSSKRSVFFRSDVPPRLRHDKARKSVSQSVQIHRILVFPNIHDAQGVRYCPTRVIGVKILFADARECGYLIPDLFGRTTPYLSNAETAPEASDRTGNVNKHVTILYARNNAPPQFGCLQTIKDQVCVTRLQ